MRTTTTTLRRTTPDNKKVARKQKLAKGRPKAPIGAPGRFPLLADLDGVLH